MRSSLDRTKVVLRHLPPTISEATLLDQIDGTFAGRYNWVSFRPGKSRFGFVFYLYCNLQGFILFEFLLFPLLLGLLEIKFSKLGFLIFFEWILVNL